MVIGITGLDASIFERLADQGRLPNLAALAKDGALGLFATLPRGTDSRIVWTSLVTGVAPENQGVGGRIMSPRGDMIDAPLVPESRTVDTVWTLLNGQGESCAVLGWPGTWPAEELDGVVVIPHLNYVLERMHGELLTDLVHPDSFIESADPLMIDPIDLRRRDLSRFVDVDSVLGLEALIGQNYEILAEAYAADRSMTDVARLVAVDPGVENVFVCLTGTDIVSQRFWHYMESEGLRGIEMQTEERRLLENQTEALDGTVDRYYEFVDELVGELVALTGDDSTIAVITDHGYVGVTLDAAGLPRVGHFMHSERGMWLISGPGVVAGGRADDHDILDVAPTIMAADAIPLPGDLDGEVLTPLLK
jgi:predicted AlkP superfamily phosphohydrolase/phosphomutase